MFVACEMERGAVRHYQRAMQLLKTLNRENEPLYDMLKEMAVDEEEHLRQFSASTDASSINSERQSMLIAMMQGWLFQGGMMGAARSGMLEDIPSMLEYAKESERVSAQKYREFAAASSDESAKAALLRIAGEETLHLEQLNSLSSLK